MTKPKDLLEEEDLAVRAKEKERARTKERVKPGMTANLLRGRPLYPEGLPEGNHPQEKRTDHLAINGG